MSSNRPMSAASMIAEVSGQWFSVCLQPWSALCTWNAYWGDRWKSWLSEIGAAPNPWLPALASDRPNQPVGIDFFLPWLPRVDAIVGSLGAAGEKDAQRVMLRAALPHVGSSSEVASEAGEAHARGVRLRIADKKSGSHAAVDATGEPSAVASPVSTVARKARVTSVEKVAVDAKPAAKRKSAAAKPKKAASAAAGPAAK